MSNKKTVIEVIKNQKSNSPLIVPDPRVYKSTGNTHLNQTKGPKQRQHCKVSLYNIVMDGLKNPAASAAIKWIKQGENFQVNWEHFVKFYHNRGKSSARETNIKNRFTRKSNGFKKDETLPDEGYDTVFYHTSWKDEPPLKRQRLSKNPKELSSPPISPTPSPTSPFSCLDQLLPQLQIQSLSSTSLPALPFPLPFALLENQFQPQQQIQPLWSPQQLIQPPSLRYTPYPQPDYTLSSSALKMIKDEDAVNLLLNPFNMIEDKSFIITEFMARMVSKFPMTQSDYNNLAFLMVSESSPQQNVNITTMEQCNQKIESITLEQFKNFLLRFGPLTKSLDKIRDFIDTGVIYWYHGKITREKAVEILKTSFNKEKCTHYLLRSVPNSEKGYVFAVSYITSDGKIFHKRIYTDPHGRFFIKMSEKERKNLDNWKHLGKTLNLEPSDVCKPVLKGTLNLEPSDFCKPVQGYF